MVSATGRSCALKVIDKNAHGFTAYAIDQAHGIDGPEIKDLEGNGRLELVVETEFTPFAGYGDNPLGTWPVIYTWNGSGYVDASSNYKVSYERHLRELKKQIAIAGAGYRSEPERRQPIVPKAPKLAIAAGDYYD